MDKENKKKLISLYDDITEILEQYNEKVALLKYTNNLFALFFIAN